MEETRNENGLTFKEWMAKVDGHIEGIVGLSSSDLADYMYHDSWSDGEGADHVAKRVIRQESQGIW